MSPEENEAKIARLRTELANLHHVIDEQRKAFGDTARQDAETIARLRKALETSSEMMKVLAVQLASWGHESVVNYRAQLAKNEALTDAS